MVGNCASTMLVDCDLRHEAGKPALTLIELAKRLQGSIFKSVGKSTYTAGVDVMQDLNQRDKTPGRAVAPYVFASVLGMDKSSTPNPFNWFGKTPMSSALTTPNVWIDQQGKPLCMSHLLSSYATQNDTAGANPFNLSLFSNVMHSVTRKADLPTTPPRSV